MLPEEGGIYNSVAFFFFSNTTSFLLALKHFISDLGTRMLYKYLKISVLKNVLDTRAARAVIYLGNNIILNAHSNQLVPTFF